jgi:hypothetical protein
MRKWLAAQFNHVPRKRPLRFTSADRPHVLSRAYATRTASISLQPKLSRGLWMDLESRTSFATQILGRLQRLATRSASERESVSAHPQQILGRMTHCMRSGQIRIAGVTTK